MSRIVLLDAGVLGLLVAAPLTPAGQALQRSCRAWYRSLNATADVAIADVTDFEVRRELIRRGAHAQIERLDEFYEGSAVAVTREAWLKAAEFWAVVRQAGFPTADPEALDADAILAGVAATVGTATEPVVIATTNVKLLGWFPGIDARGWASI